MGVMARLLCPPFVISFVLAALTLHYGCWPKSRNTNQLSFMLGTQNDLCRCFEVVCGSYQRRLLIWLIIFNFRRCFDGENDCLPSIGNPSRHLRS